MQAPSEMNPDGYFEDTLVNLLNDQVIRFFENRFGSFLHNDFECGHSDDDFDYYDLEANFIQQPPDYSDRLAAYTGNSWDVWGLTRMHPGGKWHVAYSKLGIASRDGCIRAIEVLRRSWRNQITNRVFLKDPRLVYTLKHLELDGRVVVLRRDPEAVLRSMRRHYGPRLFTNQPFEGVQWVSNHFNYQVMPQSFESYQAEFEKSIDLLRKQGYEVLELISSPNFEWSWGDLAKFLGD